MIPVARTPEYLTQLGVTMTQSSTADPAIDLFEEYLTSKPTKGVECLFNYKSAGFVYMSALKEVVVVSMVLQPRSRSHKKDWVIAQYGNTPAYGPSPVLFQAKDLQSTVLVPMNQVDAVALNLAHDPLILTKDNCPLPPKLVDDKDSFFTPDKVLTALPAVLAVGHGGLLPEDWDDLMKALVSTDKENSITGGKAQKGITKFCKETMAYFCPNMSISTAICRHGTDNYVFQEEYFGTILNRALKKQRETGPVSFDKITAKYTPETTSQRKSHPPHNSDTDSTDNGAADKRPKVAAAETEVVSCNSPFYRTLLGLASSVTTCAITNKIVLTYLPLPALHKKLVKACFSKGGSSVLEVQSVRQKYDTAMKKLSRVEYYYLPKNPIPLPLVTMIKIRQGLWSTDSPEEELVTRLSIACFTPITSKEAFDIETVSEKVTEDEEMLLPEQFCTRIDTAIHKSYKVNNKWQLITTITSFLMFLYNMANWNKQQVRPMLCEFLEQLLHRLTSEEGKSWLRIHKNVKQLPLVIITQIQQIIVLFVLAPSDDANHPTADQPDATTTFTAGSSCNLVQASCLMHYFELDLVKAIDQQKLNRIFDESTPLFKKEYPDNVPAALGRTTSPQKAAGSSQKSAQAIAAEAKVAAAATAAARSDASRRPFGNNRRPPPGNDCYGQRFPSSYNGNQQNQYDINRDRRPAPDERSKNCGVFKYNGERLPWLKSQINPTGKEHPPTVCVEATLLVVSAW